MPPDQDVENPGFTPVEKLDELSDRQKTEVREQNRPNAALIHETIRSEGIGELERTARALAFSALAAGLSMGFSMVVQGELMNILPAGPVRDVISPLGYTVGFLIVVLGRQQLFTENTLTPVLPLLHDRSRIMLLQVARLWLVVLIFNIAGAYLFATAAASGMIFGASIMHAFEHLGREAMSADFLTTFLRAIMAGWLIALMVWLLPSADNSRPLIIIIIAYVIALAGFPHIIAGSIDCIFLVQSGLTSWGNYFGRFFAPTLLGNLVGGVALVAVLNYGQVAAGIKGAA